MRILAALPLILLAVSALAQGSGTMLSTPGRGSGGSQDTNTLPVFHATNVLAENIVADTFQVDELYVGTLTLTNPIPYIPTINGTGTNLVLRQSTASYALDVQGSNNIIALLQTNMLRLTVDGRFLAYDGVDSLPGFSFHADPDTGMFRLGANTLGFSTGGNTRMRVASDGTVGIATNNPQKTLHVHGTAAINGLPGSGSVVALDSDGNLYKTNITGSADGVGTTNFQGVVAHRVSKGLPVNIAIFGDSIATFLSTPGPERFITNGLAFQGGTATANINNWVSYSGTDATAFTAIDPRWLQVGGPWWGSWAVGTNGGAGGNVQFSSTFSNSTLQANFCRFAYYNAPGLGTVAAEVQTNGSGGWVSLGSYNAASGTSNTWTTVSFPLNTGNYRFRVTSTTTNVVSELTLKNTNAAGWTWANRALGSTDIVNWLTNGAHGANYANISNVLYDANADVVVSILGDVWSSVTNYPLYWTNVVRRAGPNADAYIVNVWPQRTVANETGARQQNALMRQFAPGWGAVYVDLHSHFQSSNLIDSLSWYSANDGIHPATAACYEGFDYFVRSTGFHPFVTNYSAPFTFQQPQIRASNTGSGTNFSQGVMYVDVPGDGVATNRFSRLATNVTASALDFSVATREIWMLNSGETNVHLFPTNLVEGREVYVFLRAANNNYDVVVTNAGATTIYWPYDFTTNGATSFTVTNGQGFEMSLKTVTNAVWVRIGRSR